MTDETLTGPAAGQLLAIIERVERIEEEEDALKADKKEIYAEAKGNGYSVPILRQVVKLRKMDRAKRQENDAILDLYLSAIGEA